MEALSVTRTIHIRSPRAVVWSTITEPELVAEWFSDEAVISPAVGGAGTLTWHDFGEFRLVVEEIDAPSVFAFRWARNIDEDPVPGNSTHVRFTLVDDGGGTRLTVVETGWESLVGFDIDAAMDDNRGGWLSELDELTALLEKQDSL